MTTLRQLKAVAFKRAKTRRAYDALAGEYAMAASMIDARVKARLTQSQLAQRMGTTQSAIARLESGRSIPSGVTLLKLAKAVNRTLRVEFH